MDGKISWGSMNKLINKVKHPVLVGILCFLIGLGGAYLLQWLRIPYTYPTINNYLTGICAAIAALGAGLLFLRVIAYPNRERRLE
jgi:protein-S-isoprenylcysteine O-methyltransferase Ste14